MTTEKRLIDANILFDELIEKQFSEQSMGIMVSFYPQMRSIVAKQPTVDAVEVVHGRLGVSYMDEYYGEFADCLECGTDNILPCHYCRNCGARMDLEE